MTKFKVTYTDQFEGKDEDDVYRQLLSYLAEMAKEGEALPFAITEVREDKERIKAAHQAISEAKEYCERFKRTGIKSKLIRDAVGRCSAAIVELEHLMNGGAE